MRGIYNIWPCMVQVLLANERREDERLRTKAQRGRLTPSSVRPLLSNVTFATNFKI